MEEDLTLQLLEVDIGLCWKMIRMQLLEVEEDNGRWWKLIQMELLEVNSTLLEDDSIVAGRRFGCSCWKMIWMQLLYS